MSEQVSDRLRIIRNALGKSQVEFAQALGLKQGSYSDIERGRTKNMSESVLNLLSIKYSVNIDYLLNGEGEIFIENQTPILHPKLMTNVIMVPLVSQYAYAGYLAGYADAEYLGTLPTVPMIADHDPKGVYYAFETKGDSMNDGSIDGLKEGDLLFGRLIQQNLWRYKLHIKKWYFVIVHKTDGILVKEIIDHNPDTGEITCHSLNPSPEYEDFKINLNDVAQLFNIVQISRGMKG